MKMKSPLSFDMPPRKLLSYFREAYQLLPFFSIHSPHTTWISWNELLSKNVVSIVWLIIRMYLALGYILLAL